MNCPRCPGEALTARPSPSGPTLDFCAACGGTFYDDGEFAAVHEVLGPLPLLKEGADPNQSNGWEGYIWLMDVIADRDDTETIEMMLRNGYDPNSRDGRGSLLDVARKYGRSNTEALLQSYGAA